jgi:hypothetical protein
MYSGLAGLSLHLGAATTSIVHVWSATDRLRYEDVRYRYVLYRHGQGFSDIASSSGTTASVRQWIGHHQFATMALRRDDGDAIRGNRHAGADREHLLQISS